jgi:hypothetical protein
MPMRGEQWEGNPNLVSQSTFYKIMAGQSANADKVRRVALLWCFYERSYNLPEVPADHAGMKEWVGQHVGSLRIVHKTIFPDWPYSTLVASLQGYCKPDRLKVIHERLCAHRTAALEKRAIQEEETRRFYADNEAAMKKKEEQEAEENRLAEIAHERWALERRKREVRILLKYPGWRERLERTGRLDGLDLNDLGEDDEDH